MQVSRRQTLALTAALAAASLSIKSARAEDVVVKVILNDKGMDAGMASGLAWGTAGADMSKATMSMTATPRTIKAGRVTLLAINDSKDQIHEMIVVPMPTDGSPLPYDKQDERVDEDAAHSLGEVSELDPGTSGALTINLKAGNYLLICNVPGHYDSGMWTTLQVES